MFIKQENKMAKSLGIVASATHRMALDYYKKFDTMMKAGSLYRVANRCF